MDKTLIDIGSADWNDVDDYSKLTKKQWDEYPYDTYPLYALGISNIVVINNVKLAVTFYELDDKKTTKEILTEIIKIFPNDLVMFETRAGYHFLSFTLFNYDDVRVMIYALSKILNSHYGVYKHQLVLRVTPKKRVSTQEVVHSAPMFYKLVKKPKKNSLISFRHLTTYNTKCGLPDDIVKYYKDNCRCILGKVCFYYYRTRDD